MTNNYDPKSFWGDRFNRYGHTGEVDSLLYAYDQQQRLRAIDRALSRAKVNVNQDTKILDVGCGTGDLIELLLKYGEPEITGIDISEETIAYARRRFAAHKKVRLLATGAEEVGFPLGSFDLAIGINVLQHITNESAFCKAVDNIVRVVRAGGHILVMDFSPVMLDTSMPAPYVIFRSRGEYIDVFENLGCRFTSEFGLPRIGVRLYRTTNKIIAQLRRPPLFPTMAASATPSKNGQAISAKSRLASMVRALLLGLTRPFDNWLAPFPARYTDMRILIFKKGSERSEAESTKGINVSQCDTVYDSRCVRDNPLVSIITPVRNGVEYLELCIQSVLSQSYPHIEHVFVDGGSSDGTVEILISYATRFPDRIRFVSAPDNGVGHAWNKGLKMARGEILGWLGSDDELCGPGAIGAVVEFFKMTPDAYFVHGGCNGIDAMGATLSTHKANDFNFDELINDQNFISCPSAFYRREVIEKAGGLDAYGNDFEFMVRIAKAFKIYCVDMVLSNFRVHKGSATTGSDAKLRLMWMRQDYLVSRRYGGRFFSGYRKRYYKFLLIESLRQCLWPIYRCVPRVIKSWWDRV